MHKEYFFLVDEFVDIHMLERKRNSRQLREIKILNI